jgi:hypothetical protein
LKKANVEVNLDAGQLHGPKQGTLQPVGRKPSAW